MMIEALLSLIVMGVLVARAVSLLSHCFSVQETGSPAFVVLSTKEKAARAGLVRQRTPPQCVRDDFLGEAS
ncbi:MAG TPA: hypothetical protein VJQ26_13950, partial [Ktedonobacteraceae bacterium]|nr:hypothetical protein [Ktedonobacteraceae bacterium]